MPRALCLAAGVLGLLLLGAVALLPDVVERRERPAATPGVAPIFTRVGVPVGVRRPTCLGPVPLSAQAQTVRLLVKTPSAPGERVGVVASIAGRGLRATRTLSVRADGLEAAATLRLPASPRPARARVCVRALRSAPAGVGVVGTDAPASLTARRLEVAGRTDRAREIEVTVLTGRVSLLRSTDEVAESASVLGSGLVPAWLLLVLVVGCAVGVPAAALWAVAEAWRD